MNTSQARTGVSRWWLALSIFLLLVLAVVWATGASMYAQLSAQIQHLEQKLQQLPHIHQIALLHDARQQAAMLATYEPQSATLQLQRLNALREGREDSMQLWALRPGQPPSSLGVLTPALQTPQLQVPATALEGVSELAISVENKGGVPQAQGPRLPWLLRGPLVQKAI